MSHDAFLRAIIAEPDDDSLRLVYADFLEEQGDVARAEFIRTQLRIDALLAHVEHWARTPSNQPGGTREDGGPAGAALAEAQELQQRESALLYQHKTAWLAPWQDGDWHGITNHGGPRLTLHLKPEWTDVDVVFRRGFIDEVRCTLAEWYGGDCGNGCQQLIRPTSSRRQWMVYDSACPDSRWSVCPVCCGTGRIAGVGPTVVACQPVTKVVVTDAAIHQSGGNDTYYVGGLGVFPRKYWSRLEGLPSRAAALAALSAALIAWARQPPGSQ